MESDERGLGEGGQGDLPAGDERPAPARPWHRTPQEPEGPPPWTSSEPGEGVWGGGRSQSGEGPPGASPEQPSGQPPPAPAPGAQPSGAPPPSPPPSGAPPSSSEPTGAPPPGAPPAGAEQARGIGPAESQRPPAGEPVPPPAWGAAAPTPAGPAAAQERSGAGPSTPAPAGAPPGPPAGAPPSPPAPASGGTLPPAAIPPGPRTGGGFARGVFLYLAATSLTSGIATLLAGAHLGNGTAAAILGVIFVVLFFVAIMLRPGPAMNPVRATLGVVSVLFLVGCFALAVGAADQGGVDTSTQLVRAAAAAGLFMLGMAGVAVLIPSAVAAGLAMLGLVATVVLASAAAGVEGFGLAVAAVIAGVVDLELAFRAARLRAHPGALTWMVNVAALLTGAAATTLGISFHGTAVACAGLVGLALALSAWRWHAVVAAVAAVFPLSLVEGYAIFNATSSDSTASGVVILLVGLVLLVLIALAGMRMGKAAVTSRGRLVVFDELLLLAAVAMALVALTEVGSSFTPFQGTPFAPGGSFGTTNPEPTFEPFLTPPAFPTLPPG